MRRRPQGSGSHDGTRRSLGALAVRPPAQNILQLHGQLLRRGYADEELRLVHAAYEVAMARFSLRFQRCGKPFTAHCVGTASILADLGVPAALVAAGVVHNIYFWGDFGDDEHRGATPAKRTRLIEDLGEEVESYLAQLPLFRRALRRRGPETVLRDLADFSERQRHVLLLHLADQLEVYLDGIHLDYSEKKAAKMQAEAPIFARAAERLGYPAFGDSLARAAEAAHSAKAPPSVRCPHGPSFLVVPRSCRKRRRVAFRQWLRRRRRS